MTGSIAGVAAALALTLCVIMTGLLATALVIAAAAAAAFADAAAAAAVNDIDVHDKSIICDVAVLRLPFISLCLLRCFR